MKNPRPRLFQVTPGRSLRSDKHPANKIDQSLDCVPVRQPRNIMDNFPDKQNNLQSQAETTFTMPKVVNKNEPSSSKVPEKQNLFLMSQVPDKPKYVQMSLNCVSPQKNVVSVAPVVATRETDLLLKNLHASLRLMSEDTEGSAENSLSISRIADYLGKQSNISVTDMMQYNNKKKQLNKKQPLTELHMNILETKKNNHELQVTNLEDTRKTEMASSSGSVNTVISQNKYKLNNEVENPVAIVTHHSQTNELLIETDDTISKKSARSKSPSSKSHTTLSTVHENFTSFKSGDSPLHTSKAEANTSHVPSPNTVYKELDKSVDWHEVMLQKRSKQEGLAKGLWASLYTILREL